MGDRITTISLDMGDGVRVNMAVYPPPIANLPHLIAIVYPDGKVTLAATAETADDA